MGTDMPTDKRDLTFAATARCPCGALLAYAPDDDCWDCSAILMDVADKDKQHTARLPFTFYKVKVRRTD